MNQATTTRVGTRRDLLNLPRWLLLGLLSTLLLSTACTGRKGTRVQSSDHSTYPHHYHDGNGMPHPKTGEPLPPPHNHDHGPTWSE